MKWNLKKTITLGFSVAFIILLSVGYISYQSLTNFHETIEREKHLRKTLYLLEDVLSTLKDIETGQLGYIISGDESYLESYNSANATIVKDLLNMKSMLANRSQQLLLDTLNSLTQRKTKIASELINIRRQAGIGAASQRTVTNRGKNVMDSIRIITSKLISNEHTRFIEESDNAEISGDNATQIIIAGNACALTFLILALMVLNRDIKRRIRTEEELRKAKQIAEDAKGTQEKFLANMSHEIRTPMNAVLGMTNLMLQTQLNPKQAEYIEAIKQSSNNLLNIINDILDFTKIRAGKIEFESIHFRLKDSIQSLYNTFRFKMEEKNLDFIINIDKMLPEVIIGDPVRLNQVFINLIGNAVKFTDKGNITIACKQEKRENDMVSVIFTVTDTGIGIREEKLSSIFESFSQASSDTARKYGGTGLGLTISKQLVDLQDGDIRVDSEIGKGTTFSFILSFGIGSEENINYFDVKEVDTTDLTGIKILLVEDNKFNQVVAKDSLRLLIKDVSIDIAEQGLQAIELLKINEYDIVLMDVQMPELDGYDTTKMIRKSNALYSNLPIMAITASATTEEVQKCLKSGMNDCITKPYDLNILLTKISSLVKKKIHFHKPQIIEQKKVEGSIVNLNFLRTLTGNSNAHILKYINIMLETMPGDIEKLKKYLKEKNWNELKAIAHLLKPRINYMGIDSAKEIIRSIEHYAEDEINLEKLPELVGEIEKILQLALEELKREKDNLV